MYLSIDIGINNLGYTLSDANLSVIQFGLFDITEYSKKHYKKMDIVDSRCRSINDFFKTVINETALLGVIIEKQTPNNIVAMSLMYAIFTASLSYTSNVILFDPKLKFTYIHESYTTLNKKHKKLSIKMALEFLSNNPDLMSRFEKFTKKDDIADSLNQLIVYLKYIAQLTPLASLTYK